MPPLPEAIIAVLGAFTPLFSHPVGRHAQGLLIGAILCQGPRTVTAALRGLGLNPERRCEKFHRVLSRARGSGLPGAKLLLGLRVALWPSSWPIRGGRR
jgi:hypothetical protein